MEDHKNSQSVIVSSYVTRTKSILVTIGVVFLLYTSAQFQFNLTDSDSASNFWWVSNLIYLLFVIYMIFNFIKARNRLKNPLVAEVDDSPSQGITIQGNLKYAGKWMIKKKSTYKPQVTESKVVLLIVLLLWIMDFMNVYHYFKTPRLQTPFQKESIVQQIELAVLLTFSASRYRLFREYPWNLVLKQSGKTLVLYSKEKVGE